VYFAGVTAPLDGSGDFTMLLHDRSPHNTLSLEIELGGGLSVATSTHDGYSCLDTSDQLVAGATTVIISGAGYSSDSSGYCTVSIPVTGTSTGPKPVTVTFTVDGDGSDTLSGTVDVFAPPAISAAFSPTSVAEGVHSVLTFTITNPTANDAPLTQVGFDDTLPLGLVVADDSESVCGGTLTTTEPLGISLAGATVATDSPCQFSVTVYRPPEGYYSTTTEAVESSEGGTGNTATAALSVGFTAPTIATAFGAGTIPVGGSTSLSFVIVNLNHNEAEVRPADMGVMDLTGVGFTDTLPAGLVVATPNGSTGECGGGKIYAVAGGNIVSLSGAELAAGDSCMFSVNVTGVAGGDQQNSTGPIGSIEGGQGEPALAVLLVVAPPVTPTPTPTPKPTPTATPTVRSTSTPPTTSAGNDVGSSDTPSPVPPYAVLLAASAIVATVLLRRRVGSLPR
jgi:hypothetical protein